MAEMPWKSIRHLFLALALCSAGAPGADNFSPGETWLKWSDETRIAYVEGYIWGQERGFSEACKEAEKLWVRKPTGLPGEKCITKMPRYPNYPANYAAMISQYYSLYPADRSLSVRRLLEGMTDNHSLTVEQMHRSYHVGTGAR